MGSYIVLVFISLYQIAINFLWHLGKFFMAYSFLFNLSPELQSIRS